MRVLHRTIVSTVALAVAGLPMVAGAPASAAPARSATGAAVGGQAVALVPCLTDMTARLGKDPDRPVWRRHLDTQVTQRDLDALPAEETRKRFVAREVSPRLADRIVIPTYVHVIKGKHRGERTPAGPKRVRNLLNILNQGMAGNQSQVGASTRYRFVLRKIRYKKRDGWHHAFLNGPRDRKMKRAMHVGNARTLNLYINGGGPKNYPVLGWSRFPWQYRDAPYLDGVTVNFAAMPGGRARGYNLGDTVIHETGHWLGLFHTFQGGCSAQGDLVSDTAAEAEPSYYCETTRDTCTAPGLDPVRNFMDYSLDSCMDHLTAGQVRRIDSAFEKWRL